MALWVRLQYPAAMLRKRRKAPEIRHISASEHLGFDYQIRFSQRKTAAIEIKKEAVTVAAPFGSDAQALQQWVEQKQSWIVAKLNEQQLRRAEVPQPLFEQGEQWLFMGRPLTLELIYRSRKAPEIVGDRLFLSVNGTRETTTPEQVKRRLESWYKLQAQEYMGPKTLGYARQLGRRVTDITFRRTKTKWGHCTSRGVIQYNWLIMMAPREIIDYLIAHEVSHLVHPNHSAKFWQQVAQLAPNYLQERHWLRENGHKLDL